LSEPSNEVCPICAKPFEYKQMLIKCKRWQHETEPEQWAHVDCVYYFSRIEEKREHPPSVK
jgi:hypothetical protein